MPEAKDGCVVPAKGPMGIPEAKILPEGKIPGKEAVKMVAQVGKPAPDFEASAFVAGGFKNIKLSAFKGQWVILCFYPGDFTFV